MKRKAAPQQKTQNPITMPSLRSDADAEAFVASADLSAFDLSHFKPMHFEVEPKSAALNMRLPSSLLQALKLKAQSQGIPYTRYVRMLLEADIAQPVPPRQTPHRP